VDDPGGIAVFVSTLPYDGPSATGLI